MQCVQATSESKTRVTPASMVARWEEITVDSRKQQWPFERNRLLLGAISCSSQHDPWKYCTLIHSSETLAARCKCFSSTSQVTCSSFANEPERQSLSCHLTVSACSVARNTSRPELRAFWYRSAPLWGNKERSDKRKTVFSMVTSTINCIVTSTINCIVTFTITWIVTSTINCIVTSTINCIVTSTINCTVTSTSTALSRSQSPGLSRPQSTALSRPQSPALSRSQSTALSRLQSPALSLHPKPCFSSF